MRRVVARIAPALIVLSCALDGCGLDVKSADLFVLMRTGQGRPLTLLVNDGGTISCDGGSPRQLSSGLLLQARALVTSLGKDAKAGLDLPSGANSVFGFRIKLQEGTIAFPDTAAGTHPELAQAELFAVQAASGPCGLPG